MQVVVASRNPVKIAAAEQVFVRSFPHAALQVTGVSVPSGVADQPLTAEETLLGAENRVRHAQQQLPEATYTVGIEGGVAWQEGRLMCFAAIVVAGPGGQTQCLMTPYFWLPPAVAELVERGVELGDADDQVFGHSNSKQQMGAVGILTQGQIDRQALYAHTLQLCIIPFCRPELYPGVSGAGLAGL
ncbi:inosine/xanthosine triphosphatase [Candidatus Peribacteria bacterium]|nr:inosine/xanthosine triphosphatase [Candidatus Peribacteria bacterium]